MRADALVIALAIVGHHTTAIAEDAIASPTVKFVGGNVQITYGNITYSRSFPVKAPSLAAIQAMVGRVIKEHALLSSDEFESYMNMALDEFDGLHSELIQIRTGQRGTVRQLERIEQMMLAGQTREARDELDKIQDPWRTAWRLSIELGSQLESERGIDQRYRLGAHVSREVYAWPCTRSYSLAVGGSLFVSRGEATGGFMSPAPTGDLLQPATYTATSYGLGIDVEVLMRREHTIQPLVHASFSWGEFEFAAPHGGPSSIDGMLLQPAAGAGLIVRPTTKLVLGLSVDLALESAKRPIFSYTGLGAGYDLPKPHLIGSVATSLAVGVRL